MELIEIYKKIVFEPPKDEVRDKKGERVSGPSEGERKRRVEDLNRSYT